MSGLPSASEVATFLFHAQQRDLLRDDGHGYRTTRQIGERFGFTTREARKPLRAFLLTLVEAGRIREGGFCNSLAFRSINPLPWESGGKWPGQAERELAELRLRRDVAKDEAARCEEQIFIAEAALKSAIAKATGAGQ